MFAGHPPIADRLRFLLASAASLGALTTGLPLQAQTAPTPAAGRHHCSASSKAQASAAAHGAPV